MNASDVWKLRDKTRGVDFYEPGEEDHPYFSGCFVIEFPLYDLIELQELDQFRGTFTQISGTSPNGETWALIMSDPSWHSGGAAEAKRLLLSALALPVWGEQAKDAA